MLECRDDPPRGELMVCRKAKFRPKCAEEETVETTGWRRSKQKQPCQGRSPGGLLESLEARRPKMSRLSERGAWMAKLPAKV